MCSNWFISPRMVEDAKYPAPNTRPRRFMLWVERTMPHRRGPLAWLSANQFSRPSSYLPYLGCSRMPFHPKRYDEDTFLCREMNCAPSPYTTFASPAAHIQNWSKLPVWSAYRTICGKAPTSKLQEDCAKRYLDGCTEQILYAAANLRFRSVKFRLPGSTATRVINKTIRSLTILKT